MDEKTSTNGQKDKETHRHTWFLFRWQACYRSMVPHAAGHTGKSNGGRVIVASDVKPLPLAIPCLKYADVGVGRDVWQLAWLICKNNQ